MRSKEEIEKMLETYDKALNGDPDAMILIGSLILGQSNNGGVKDGKNSENAGRGDIE